MTATALAVAGVLWRRLRRDRVGLAFTFLLPIALAVVMAGIAQGGTPRVGVVDRSAAGVGAAVEARLAAGGLVEVRRYADRPGLERAVRRREVAAGVVVPPGAGDAGDAARVDLVGPPGVAAPGGVRAVVESAVADTAAALALGHALDPGADASTALVAGTRALGDDPAGPAPGASARRHDDVAGALVGTLVLFTFVNTVGGAGTLADLRQLGVLARARAVGAPPGRVRGRRRAGDGVPRRGPGGAAGRHRPARLRCRLGRRGGLRRGVGGDRGRGRWQRACSSPRSCPRPRPAARWPAPWPSWPGCSAAACGRCRSWGRRCGCSAISRPTPGRSRPSARTGVDGAGLTAVAGPLAVLGAVAAGTAALGGWRLHHIAGHA